MPKASQDRITREVGNRSFVDHIRSKFGLDQGYYWHLLEHFVGPVGTTLPGWLATSDTSSAGSPTLAYVANASGGTYTLTHDSQSEQQNLALYGGDHLPLNTAKEPWCEIRLKLNTAGAAMSADQRLVFGMAAARNATLDTSATHAWFRVEGANFDLLTEVDDNASGNDDDNDSTLNWSDNAYATFRVRLDSVGMAIFEVNLEAGAGWQVAGAPLDLTALVASSVNWQPYIEIQRDAGTEQEAVTIDYIAIGAKV